VKTYEELKRLFLTSMKRNFELFGRESFRISKTGMKRSPINKALFDSWGTILAFLSETDYKILLDKREVLLSKYDNKKEEGEFYDAVSRTAWQKSKVDVRFKEIESLIQETIQ
jgi:hypothetical protein